MTTPIKSLTLVLLLLITSWGLTASGQVKSATPANNHTSAKPGVPTPTPANTTRARVIGQQSTSLPANNGREPNQRAAKPAFKSNSEPLRVGPTLANSEKTALPAGNNRPSNRVKMGHTVLKASGFTDARPSDASLPGSPNTAAIATTSSQIYRVGVRDVLDIQLPDNPGKSSTLFTVLEGGVLEYPLIGNPIVVAGMTASEIAALLHRQLKIFDNPTVVVNVRDYASHTVTITGFVAAPGRKILRREAMPLYAILAEAMVLPEAASVTITRPGRTPFVVDLSNANLSATMIISGDAIKVSGMPAGPGEFFFIGGNINSPGQKPYHMGLTLTQAILASGGINSEAAKVKVSRQGAGGLLTTQEYNLRKIQNGKIPDPILQKGDRIEVSHTN